MSDIIGLPAEVAITMFSGIGGWIMKLISINTQNRWETIKLGMQNAELVNSFANDAAKRGTPIARKILAIGVVLPLIFAIIAVAFVRDIPVSVLVEVPQRVFAWGLLKWGSIYQVIEMNGLAFPQWLRLVLLSIIGFYFGTGAAKVSR